MEWIAVFGKPAQVMVADGLGLALLVPYDHGRFFSSRNAASVLEFTKPGRTCRD